MPIASYTIEEQLPTKPNLPSIQPKNVESILIDDQETPIRSLISFVEGAPWTVNYYSQLVSKHNDIREIDPGSPNIVQQYQKIVNLEIRVSQALNDSYDNTTGITTVIGNGLMYGNVLPNKSDYFVTDTGDAKKGVFIITNVERKNFNTDSAFFVEYQLVGFSDTTNGADSYQALEERVIRTYYFSKERLIDGLQPLVKEQDHVQIENLKISFKELVKYYFKTFFNRKYMTLVLPGQPIAIYDAFLVDYILKIVDSFDADEIRLMKQLPTDFEEFLSQPQFWKLLLDRDYNGVSYCNQKMGLVDKHGFNSSTWIRGLIYTNIDYVIYPSETDKTYLVREDIRPKVMSVETVIETKSILGTAASSIALSYPELNRNIPYFHPIISDDYYVMSSEFYNKTSDQSLIEILTKDYLNKQSINLTKLYSLVNSFRKWSRLEQYYYGPVLLTLIKEADRGTYT